MKVLRRALFITFAAVLLVTVYIRLSSKGASDNEAAIDNSEIGQLLARDMDLNYPANPYDVVTLYSRIIKVFYEGGYTDDQLNGLVQHARAMFDNELLSYNDYDGYMERLKEEIESYKLNNKKIIDYTVQRASDIEFLTDSGVQYAKVKVIYYTLESGSKRNKVYEEYTLRQNENGQWKILYWDVISETSVKGE